jgi:hypothetical protein
MVMSTAAYANHSMLPIHHPNRHTSRDDLINSCVALPLQYASSAIPLHTATTDRLRDQGVTLCRGGARMIGVEKLEQALNDIGVTRYDRLARNFLASVCLVAAIVWWIL